MKLEAEAADDAEDAAAVAKGRGCWGGVGRRGGGGGRRFAASPGGVSSVALMAKATLPPLFSLGSCVRFRLCRGSRYHSLRDHHHHHARGVPFSSRATHGLIPAGAPPPSSLLRGHRHPALTTLAPLPCRRRRPPARTGRPRAPGAAAPAPAAAAPPAALRAPVVRCHGARAHA